MCQVYDAFVRAPAARASYAELLTDLATGPLPQLFHCTAGKDRTGWAAALLLEIAGVDRATILADYLLTNTFSSATRAKYLALIGEHLGADKVAVYEPTMVVEPEFLQTAYDAVDRALRLGRRLPARRARPRRRDRSRSCVPDWSTEVTLVR